MAEKDTALVRKIGMIGGDIEGAGEEFPCHNVRYKICPICSQPFPAP